MPVSLCNDAPCCQSPMRRVDVGSEPRSVKNSTGRIGRFDGSLAPGSFVHPTNGLAPVAGSPNPFTPGVLQITALVFAFVIVRTPNDRGCSSLYQATMPSASFVAPNPLSTVLSLKSGCERGGLLASGSP